MSEKVIKRKIEEDKIVVFYIDGEWDTMKFAHFFHYVNTIISYLTNKSRGFIDTESSSKKERKLLYNIFGSPIKSIKYSSPGLIEIIVSSPLIIAFLRFFMHYVPNSKTIAETEKLQAETRRIEIESLKEIGLTEEEIKELSENRLRHLFLMFDSMFPLFNGNLITKIEEKELDEN